MKRRILLLLFGFILGSLGAYLFLRPQPRTPPATPAPEVPAIVPIEDGKTIDFSSGQPDIRETPEDRAALEQAVREMEAAAKEVTFGPSQPRPAP